MKKWNRGGISVKARWVCAILLLTYMPARLAVSARASRGAALQNLVDNDRVKAALDWFEPNTSWINSQQIRLTEIPAPPFKESQRAAAMKDLLAGIGFPVQLDKLGNVIAEWRGTNEKEIVLVSAHLDTVFPPGTDVAVHQENGRLRAPGISDNGSGLAALLAVGRAVTASQLRPRRTVLFVANVGEEGEGNLRGMRAIVESYGSRLKAVIVIDGSGTDHVTAKALASRRLEVSVTGPGGHSWSDFGMPNPINALVRGSVRFINTKVPANPRTTFNIGQIEGGTSVNSIPHDARMKVDIRSESEDELARLQTALRECISAGVRDEMESARDRSRGNLEWRVELVGSRPGGELTSDTLLLAALRAADEFVGNQSRIERSSTDANIPLSLGIDAISIGAGGAGGGAHSLSEWYDPAGREKGLKRALLTILGVAGVAEEKTQ